MTNIECSSNWQYDSAIIFLPEVALIYLKQYNCYSTEWH